MPREYAYYLIQSSLNEIWAKTLSFWKEIKGKVKEQSISPNGCTRFMKISTGTRMRIYAFSFGESYEMHFGYDSAQKLTYITIEIDYSIFGGRGFIWKMPRETIDEWAHTMGVTPNKMEGKQSKAFFEIQTKIDQFGDSSENPEEKYCQYCGVKNTLLETYCIQCGSKI